MAALATRTRKRLAWPNISSRLSGTLARAPARPECDRNYPRDVYFIGNLRSVQTALRAAPVGSAGRIEMQTKIAPFALGGQFRLQPPEPPLVLQVEVSWSVYYRVFPSLDQQRKHLQQDFPAPDPSQPPERREQKRKQARNRN
jgi:hypothetical protein